MENEKTRKILDSLAIVHHSNISPSKGGPPGYLYNLYCGFAEKKPDYLCIEKDNEGHENSENRKQENKLIEALRKNEDLRIILFYLKQGIIYKRKLSNKLNDYNIIHVHTSESVIYIRKFCKFKGIIIFTPHRPETLDNEIIAGSKQPNRKHRVLRSFLKYAEVTSYKCCDGFIFPSTGAEDVYKSFPGYRRYGEKKPHEYVYTGIRRRNVTIDKDTYRSNSNIRNDSFVVGYIGRHSYIKGYDRLVEIFSALKNNGVEVVVAGDQSDIIPPQDSLWHELGYISDSQNLINAADVIVVPNRDTYFDLIILEALSQGKIVISSNTGGNRDLAKDTDALILFNNSSADLLKKILEVKNMTSEKQRSIEENAVCFWERNCSVEEFAKGYLKCIYNLYEKISK